jgi:hypothetical protein
MPQSSHPRSGRLTTLRSRSAGGTVTLTARLVPPPAGPPQLSPFEPSRVVLLAPIAGLVAGRVDREKSGGRL